jgi:CRP/FNR family transcriptional regulator, cyclic AMP receptor protein
MNLETSAPIHPAFLVLDEDARKWINHSCNKKVLRKGDVLVNQGEVWPFLFIIQKGKVVAEKDSAEGRSLIAATFSKGELFWGLGFFHENAGMPATLRITEDVELLLWSRRDLLPIIEENGKFSWELAKLVIQRMQQASEILESMTFHPIAVRLARLLLEISGSDQANPIERNLTLDEMASRVGSTREMVCRLLYKFSDEGLIKINRTEFTIISPEDLISRAQK